MSFSTPRTRQRSFDSARQYHAPLRWSHAIRTGRGGDLTCAYTVAHVFVRRRPAECVRGGALEHRLRTQCCGATAACPGFSYWDRSVFGCIKRNCYMTIEEQKKRTRTTRSVVPFQNVESRFAIRSFPCNMSTALAQQPSCIKIPITVLRVCRLLSRILPFRPFFRHRLFRYVVGVQWNLVDPTHIRPRYCRITETADYWGFL